MGSACSSDDKGRSSATSGGGGGPRRSRSSTHRSMRAGTSSRKSLVPASKSQRSDRQTDRTFVSATEGGGGGDGAHFSAIATAESDAAASGSATLGLTSDPDRGMPLSTDEVSESATSAPLSQRTPPSAHVHKRGRHRRRGRAVAGSSGTDGGNVAMLKQFASRSRPPDENPNVAPPYHDDLSGDLASLSIMPPGHAAAPPQPPEGPSVACRIGVGRGATDIDAVLEGDTDGRRSAFSDATTTGGGDATAGSASSYPRHSSVSRRASSQASIATPNPLRSSDAPATLGRETM